MLNIQLLYCMIYKLMDLKSILSYMNIYYLYLVLD